MKFSFSSRRPAEDLRSIENAKNRGYFKIKSAASAFNFDFNGKTVLDIGSSTGGFTQYALEHGATKVIAVEKGTNQMVSPLRHDPRVDLHEKTDIFDFKITDIPSSGRSEGISVILADVSFVSLTKVLNHARKNLAGKDTEFLVMVKPQFEANEAELNRGIVKNERIRREILKRFETWLKQNGFFVLDKHDNELKGKNGNKERFYLLKLAKATQNKPSF